MKDELSSDDLSGQSFPLKGSDLGYPGELALDTKKYLPYLEDCDITEAQKAELLSVLWSIMRGFVELGWGVNSIQTFIPALAEFSSGDDSGAVEMDMPKSQFNSAATDEPAKETDS